METKSGLPSAIPAGFDSGFGGFGIGKKSEHAIDGVTASAVEMKGSYVLAMMKR